ncbi:hypothetical protein TSUD_337450 [Trifolium subterraneum]|uniref:Membrane-associated kinase regulator 4 n=1 Tax=Trifolium subterraneum TaxID=3900 RepID=A0A2Z6MZT4_TRISU|nr:hypothetical protein TSUD_337450 [Trifolium subterraneum]
MATHKVPLVRIDEEYIDMLMSPYTKQSPQKQNKDLLMPLPKLSYKGSKSQRFSSGGSNHLEYQFPCSTKKVKHAKKFMLVQKLNSYKAYLKSLLAKTACSADKSNVAESTYKPKCNHYDEGAKRKSFQNFYDENNVVNQNRRSSSSSTFSINLNSEMEGSIVDAIAHCKQSQQGYGSASNKGSHA